MSEDEVRGLLDDVRAGRLSRREFVQTMVALGLTAPLASQLLAGAGRGCARRAVPAAALDAVADQHLAQRAGDMKANGAAQAAAACNRIGHGPSPSESTTLVASPERTASTAVSTSASGKRCEISRSSGSRPRR